MTALTKILALREGGAVERFHTVPHIGPARVDSHAHNAVSMLFVLHPDPSMKLVKALHWHDSAERWVGDMPGSIKWRNPGLKAAIDAAEAEYMEQLGIDPILLTPDEELWLKEMDMLEMMFYCLEQRAMGNTLLLPTMTDFWRWVDANNAILHAPVRALIGSLSAYRRITNEEIAPDANHTRLGLEGTCTCFACRVD